MRKTVSIAAGIAAAATFAFVVQSCGSDTTAPTGKQYVANMIAANEQAGITTTGTGVFTFVDLGTEIDWTLTLTNMTAVIASHIHLGDATAVNATAGPVIINLFIPNGPTATLNGVVTHGVITNAINANVSLDSLRVLLNNGHAYANVHTSAHPQGEIRDQIHPVP
jgi:CHRD domain